MKKTQRLIVVIGEPSLITQCIETINGFHACRIIKFLSQEILNNVYYYNKNAVYFAKNYNFAWSNYNPIIIQLSKYGTNIERSMLGVNDIVNDFPKLLENYNIDAGDHSSHDSSNVSHTHSTQNCLLCKIRDRKSEEPEHIVYETQSFYVVPGTGAFFEGYLMIVPKKHVMSFALLSKDELNEFYSLLDDLRSILEGIYGKKVFAFECGSGRTGAGKHETSIVHAHFHLAPTEMPVLHEVQKSGLHPALIDKIDLGEYGEYPYMLYVDQEDNWFIASDPHDYYPRQHPRQVLANWMGCYDIYNWRIYPFRERMDTIASEFRNFCKDNYLLLPEWVRSSIIFED